MRKPVLLKSIQNCVESCENLATACTQTEKQMYRDCLGVALDCADAGMILSMKLLSDSDLHRNLVKQYIACCKACIAACQKYSCPQATHAILNCKESIKACNVYIMEHLHTDQYYFVPDTASSKIYSQKNKYEAVN